MKHKNTIRKIMIAGIWFLMVSGMMTLLIAANRKKRNQVCKKILITVTGAGDHYYLDKSDIESVLKKVNNGNLIQQSVKEINLAKLENELERNPWIEDAELYFDSRSALHVAVSERQPAVRVFTESGRSFYLDSAAVRLPLLEKISVRVPVVTNFPDYKKAKRKDSLLLNDVKRITAFVSQHPFWNAQIAQIDLTADRTFELIPTIGHHVIRIGNADDLQQKFSRLLVFYRQVLSRTGFDKYSALDVRFDGQVVAVNKVASAAVDSVLLRRNIEELMKSSLAEREGITENSAAGKSDNFMAVSTTNKNNRPLHTKAVKKIKRKNERPVVPKKLSVVTNKTKPSPIRKETEKKPRTIVKPPSKQKTEGKKPKAVMPRRN